METILQIIFSLIALGFLVFIHELGHYIVALKVKMTVEVFSIGFGRPIYSWMRNGVKWQIGWLPFGGYVKIAGTDLNKNSSFDTPGTYFAAKPIDRLKVAIAGPIANLLLAFILFCLIWMSGGREKLFSEFTKRLGWIDTHSEVYSEGLRPGDILESYNGSTYQGIKDLTYGAFFSDKNALLKGYHVNQFTEEKTPFTYSVAPYPLKSSLSELRTYGILNPASYLIYNRFGRFDNPLPSGSPMQGSGIEYGDRILWVDGHMVFSQEEVSFLINQPNILLSIERNGKRFFARIPRVQVSEVKLPADVKAELSDWQYLAGLKGKLSSTYILPYNFSETAIVEGDLTFVDPEIKESLFPPSPFSSIEQPLLKGDKVVAVGTQAINHASELLKAIQTKEVLIIVQKNTNITPVSWKRADADFNQDLAISDVEDMASQIANGSPLTTYKELALLKPIKPKMLQNFAITEEEKAQFQKEVLQTKKLIEEINDPNERSFALQTFQNNLQLLKLGINLQDLKVNYNPNPLALFSNVFQETFQTLVALVSGYVNPKMLSGPVGIVRVIQQGWSISINEALFWIAAISINLGFLNLLPIPVLDGGYILISLFEMITGKRVKPKTLERLILPFVILLIGFLIFVTYFDLMRL